MSRFNQDSRPLDGALVRDRITQLLQPGQWFSPRPIGLEGPAVEEIPWEIFRGRLVDPLLTREKSRFLSWRLQQDGNDSISVKWESSTGQIHVVRYLLSHAETPSENAGVIETNIAKRWLPELVGSIDPMRFLTMGALVDELTHRVWLAVIGTSRLPLHSVEAPLPSFVVGELAYIPRDAVGDGPWPDPLAALGPDLSWREMIKLIEVWLRSPQGSDVSAFLIAWPRTEQGFDGVPALLQSLFNEVSLSPWTRLAENAVHLLASLSERGLITVEAEIDWHGVLIRQLGRHLSAYDLVLYHYRGANYPDALLIDLLLGRYLQLAETHAELFIPAGSVRASWQLAPRGTSCQLVRNEPLLRRRALRTGFLIRRRYEGHRVPDAPTSPGEATRVWPSDLPKAPEEQILDSRARTKVLFEHGSTQKLLTSVTMPVLEASLRDLDMVDERTELGVALFIDRPLGYDLLPGEPDETPLLAHACYSPTLAQRRLRELADFGVQGEAPQTPGVPLDLIAEPGRPTVSLSDARKVASDFVVLRTMPSGLRALWEYRQWTGSLPCVCVRLAEGLTMFDSQYRRIGPPG